MTFCFPFFRSGRCLASGLILILLLLVGGAHTGWAHGRGPLHRAAAAWTAIGTGRGDTRRQHLHRKGLLHGLLVPGCQRHHRVRHHRTR